MEIFRTIQQTVYRWVLIAFKREFPFDEVLRLWEVWMDVPRRCFDI